MTASAIGDNLVKKFLNTLINESKFLSLMRFDPREMQEAVPKLLSEYSHLVQS
jgi:hypothetical protein